MCNFPMKTLRMFEKIKSNSYYVQSPTPHSLSSKRGRRKLRSQDARENMFEALKSNVRHTIASERGGVVPIQIKPQGVSAQLVSHCVALNLVPINITDGEGKRLDQFESAYIKVGQHLKEATIANSQTVQVSANLSAIHGEHMSKNITKLEAANTGMVKVARANIIEPATPPGLPEMGFDSSTDERLSRQDETTLKELRERNSNLGKVDGAESLTAEEQETLSGLEQRYEMFLEEGLNKLKSQTSEEVVRVHFIKDWGSAPEDTDHVQEQFLTIEAEEARWMELVEERFN